MARYTVELRELINNEGVKPLIDKALSTYPIYQSISQVEDVKYLIPSREQLNNKLLNHYKYREIGFETVGRFLDELEITMNEIMPFYNQMYKTVETMFNIDDIFGNVNVTETFKEERSGTAKTTDSGSSTSSANDSSNTTSSVNSTSKTLESETPQGNISKTASQIDDVTHADKGTWTKNTSSDSAETSGQSSSNASSESESNSESSGIVEHTFTKKGNQGVNTYAHDMNEFRTSIIDVTNQILEDKRIKELFMQVY